jgi:Tfp pilus assembly protein PilO
MPTLSLSKKLLSPNIRVFIPPLIFLGALIIVSILIARLGFVRLTKQRETLTEAKKNESVLTQKEGILRSVATEIPIYAKTVALVLPEKNPAITMITQLKNLAVLNAVTLGNFKVGAAAGNETLSTLDITFGIDGEITQVVGYINSIRSLAPVSTLEKSKINQSTGVVRADVTIRLYFSAFPKKLPALAEPQRELSSDERDLLTKLAGLTLPPTISLSPQPASIRENPFD